MRWQYKSLALRTVAHSPIGRESLHYLLQRLAGGLREKPDPRKNFVECVKLVERLQAAGVLISGARIMEVGTGRGMDMLLGFFLAGAASVISFDLHRYLIPDRVAATLGAIRQNQAEIRSLLRPVTDPDELDERLTVLCQAQALEDLARDCRIQYRAPADAGETGLPAGSIDLHFSYTVFEHVPERDLVRILKEARRLLSARGVALHHIDCSDHFAQSDPEISKINFLQFSEQEWKRYAGNQYAYHNRLRAPDYERIFAESGHQILNCDAYCDQRSLREIQSGFPLDERFHGYAPESLAADISVVLSRPAELTGSRRMNRPGELREEM